MNPSFERQFFLQRKHWPTHETVAQLLAQSKRQRFKFIREFTDGRQVTRLCKLLQVSRSGYYKWKSWPYSKVVKRRQAVAIEIRKIHQTVSPDYGVRRIHNELHRRGFDCGRWTVQTVMNEAGLAARKLPKRFLPQGPTVRILRCHSEKSEAGDLVEKNFQVQSINSVWLVDVTTIDTREGKLYLCVVEDLCSRLVVGHAFDCHTTPSLACRAIRLAMIRRKPARGLVIHSDSSMPFDLPEYRLFLKRYSLVQSRGSDGCAANSPIEGFFSTLKRERVNWNFYLTREDAKKSVSQYIERFYNTVRQHSALGYRSPQEFEFATGLKDNQKAV